MSRWVSLSRSQVGPRVPCLGFRGLGLSETPTSSKVDAECPVTIRSSPGAVCGDRHGSSPVSFDHA